jgi:2-polyprenyl-3-methyl-5-hydroxy-6-metoxy-1,4-benzoquinol methylase
MFKYRSTQSELLDATEINTEALRLNLYELEIINKYLSGHTVSLKGLKVILKNNPTSNRFYDIGCGGGDTLKAVAKYLNTLQLDLNLIGIDLKQTCIDYAIENCVDESRIEFICDDVFNVLHQLKEGDIVHCSLFMHHFSNEQIIEMLKIVLSKRAIFLINDLERNRSAYLGIKLLTSIFSKSELVRHDAPLSVLRGFHLHEWSYILKMAGSKNNSLKRVPMFRHLIIIYPNE